jgi:hypothetical protein
VRLSAAHVTGGRAPNAEALCCTGNIRVYCRVRPQSEKEVAERVSSVVECPGEDEILIGSAGAQKSFLFDKVFAPSATQPQVFEEVQPFVRSAVDGYRQELAARGTLARGSQRRVRSVCIFAYGQTGSGKTHTLVC